MRTRVILIFFGFCFVLYGYVFIIFSSFLGVETISKPDGDCGHQEESPSNNTHNTAILYLMKPRDKAIFKSFTSLCQFYKPHTHPIMLGHFAEEKNNTQFNSFLKKIDRWFSVRQSKCPFPHRFFSIKERSTQPDNYKRMCNYFAAGFLLDPSLKEFTYIIRFDADSRLTREPPVPIITQTHNYLYTYHCWYFEHPELTENMPKFIEEYVASHRIDPSYPTFQIPTNTSGVAMPYTNFFVVNREVLSSNTALIQFLDAASNGTSEHRWGDAPIWGMAIGLFLKEHEVNHIQLDYIHKFFHTFRTAIFDSRFKMWDDLDGQCGYVHRKTMI